jgi:flagellar basal body P-ring protein FlgI
MRRMVPRGAWARRALVAIAVVALLPLGAGPTKKKKETPPKVDETVGDLAFVVSKGEMKVEGVGLVVGLDNTGTDPPPSPFRKQLVDEMSKAGVEKADKLLANPQVSMVMVRLMIPIGVDPKDPLDVQVSVPDGCGTKSLAGGYLLLTRLHETLIAQGTLKNGPELAIAQGPIMLGTPAKPNDPKVGRVLGGGRVKKSHPYTLVINENRESVRTAKLLEKVVNERFHQFEDGHQKGAANAKTPSYLELKVPSIYHQNQAHFFSVVRNLQMIDTPDLRARRIAAWSKMLLDPTTAGVAALKLEGGGADAVDSLKEGLKSANAQVRFFSAESLAYLDEPAGVEALGEAAINQPSFRVYALAALAAMDQPSSHQKLRQLMDQPDVELRYGAFNSLRTLDPRDPFLGLVRLIDPPKQADDDLEDSPDAMAVAMARATRRRRTQPRDPFALYVVESEGPPLVHISRSRRSEIVIFGHQQKLLTPVVLYAGPISLNAALSDEKLEISKITPSKYGDSDAKITSSLDLGEVVTRAANLGAAYPEVVAILESAFQRRNLPGQLVVDAVPSARREYTDAVMGRDLTAKRDDSVKRTAGPKQNRRRFLGLFGRGSDDSTESTAAPASSKATTSPVTSSPASTPPASGAGGQAAQGNTGGTQSPANPGQTDSTTTNPTVKKDDAVQKTAADGNDTQPKRSFFDLFRRGDDS